MGQMREAIDNFDEREVDRIEAIVRSMTPAERRTPKIINGSRRARIARGSGSTPTDVNQLLDRFDGARKMMAQMSRGGMSGMPGMGNLPGMGKKGRGRGAPPRGKKGKSGNPAKRAEQERLATDREAGIVPRAPQGSAFGLGAAPREQRDATAPELPAGLGKLFGR